MKYMGSKSRIAKDIVPIIQKYIDNNETDNYYEPFVGGCNIIDKINSTHKYASDLNKYLIALLTHVSNGGELYDSVSRELYNEAKVAYKNNDKTKFEDYQIANIGFLASYNGRWFDGGYAKPVYEKTKTGLRYRDYYREAKDNLLKQATDLKGIAFSVCDYKEAYPNGFVVYCDPPYNNTTGYENSKDFNFEEFWDTMDKWSENNIVLVSELNAPENWISIWSKEVVRSLNTKDKSVATENLFIHKKYENMLNL